MSETGELIEWNDDRGFGFVRAAGGERLFVHIKSIQRIATRPRIGDRLTFTRGTGRDGRPAVASAKILGANPVDPRAARRGITVPAQNPMRARTALRFAVAALLLALAFATALIGRGPIWVPVAYLVMGVVSIVAYWVDKRAAENDRWRTPERTLHAIDLAGGIAGGLVAQALLIHKTSKAGFALVTFGIALIHAVALTALLAGAFELG
jgi:uncharacterized membrane protein YsdA (DUF1294 family)/cold shock CspA family protein